MQVDVELASGKPLKIQTVRSRARTERKIRKTLKMLASYCIQIIEPTRR
jgi:hypothetical protein